MEEIWHDIKGYEGLYQVSNYGNIKSMSRIRQGKKNRFYSTKKRILKPHFNKKRGYYQVILMKNGVIKLFTCHRLVAKTFLINIRNKKYVNHINGNKLDNKVENLEWCTHSENIVHAYKNNLISSKKKRPNGLHYNTKHKI